MEIMQHV